MLSKRDRLINEFCKNGQIERFRDSFSEILDKLETSNCRLAARYDENRSSHEFHSDGCMIRVCLNQIYEEPIHLLWTILHEFGHHLSGRPRKTREFQIKIKREQLAWEFARKLVLEDTNLSPFVQNFDVYTSLCLRSYTENLNEKKYKTFLSFLNNTFYKMRINKTKSLGMPQTDEFG